MRAAVLLIALAVLSSLTVQAATAAANSLPRPDLPPTASENLPPRPKGEGWRRVSNFSDATDSKCIGRPRTPLCAVETFLKAFISDDGALYDSMLVPEKRVVSPSNRPIFDSPHLILFRIAYDGPRACAKLFQSGNFSECPKSDRMMILQTLRCNYSRQLEEWWCDPEDPRAIESYFFRAEGGTWRISGTEASRY